MNFMRNEAAYLIDKQKLVIQSCSIPEISAKDVLVKIHYVGICGSDMHIFEDPFHAVKDIKLPVILGHECAGEVIEVGEEVRHLKPGDYVALEPGVPCGQCEYCITGRYNLCPDVKFLGARPWISGAFSRYVSHPGRWVYKLPRGMDAIEGALLEPLAVGMHAVNRAAPAPGSKILILGAGCIGLMTLEACRARGMNNITVADLYDIRLDMAKNLGARYVVNSSQEELINDSKMVTDTEGFDIIFETAGSQKTAAISADLVKRGGKIVMVGNIFGDTPFSFFRTNCKEADILGVFRYCNIYPAAIEACVEKQVDTKKIVTNCFGFEQIQNAMEYAIHSKEEAVKTIIKMES